MDDWQADEDYRLADPAGAQRRLLMAVITRAIEDCCQTLLRSEIRAQQNRAYEAIQALRWLFAPNGIVGWYCVMLDLDENDLRKRLLASMWDSSTSTVSLQAEQKRLFRLRYTWAKRDGILIEPYDMDAETRRDNERGKDGSETDGS
jgi:hypothetical protein